MNNNDKPNQTIMQYLDGELSGTALDEFKKTLKDSPQLQAELENLELAKAAVNHYGLKQQVASVHQDMMAEFKKEAPPQPQTVVYPFARNLMRVAAALIMFGLLFGAYEYVSVSPANLSQDIYQPYQLSVERGAAATSAIETNFSANNFNAVINNFEKSSNPAIKDRFLAAQAYLSLNQPAKAILQFKQVLNSQTSAAEFKDDAEYYLALSYIKNSQPAKAKPLLDTIYLDKDHLYHQQVSYFTLLKLKMLIIKNPGQ